MKTVFATVLGGVVLVLLLWLYAGRDDGDGAAVLIPGELGASSQANPDRGAEAELVQAPKLTEEPEEEPEPEPTEMGPIRQVPVAVVGVDGEPPAFASLLVTRSGASRPQPRRVRWAPGSPMLPLDPGLWRVCAEEVRQSAYSRLDSGAPLRSKSAIVSMPRSSEEPVLVLALEPETAISVRVSAAGGSLAHEEVYVKLLPFFRGETPSRQALSDSPLSRKVRMEEPFLLCNWEPGWYRIGASWSRRGHIVADAILQVVKGQTDVDLRIPASALDSFLSLRCFDPDGLPVAATGFDLGARDEEGRLSSVSGSLSPPQGGVQRLELPSRLLNDATTNWSALYITVLHGDYGSARQPLTIGQTEVDLHFSRPASLRLVVVGIRAEHEGRVQVQLVPRGMDGRTTLHGEAALESSNVWRFEDVEPGLYEAQAVLATTNLDRPSRGWVLSRAVLALRPGFRTHELVASPVHSQTIHAPAESPGTSVFLIPEGWRELGDEPFPPRFTLDDERRAVLPSIPAGTYTVRAGQSKGEVRVPGGVLELRR